MVLLVHQIMTELNQAFRYYEFDVLLAISGSKYLDGISRLYYFFPDGRIEEIDNEKPYKCIGSGNTHSTIFLKKIWKNDMKMEETAQLRYFIVKYIVKFKLDDSIGVGNNPPFHVLQIHYLPNNQNDIRLDDKKLEQFDLITNEKLEKFEKSLNDVFV
jgi:20S proteasome alpha/beta subunit